VNGEETKLNKTKNPQKKKTCKIQNWKRKKCKQQNWKPCKTTPLSLDIPQKSKIP